MQARSRNNWRATVSRSRKEPSAESCWRFFWRNESKSSSGNKKSWSCILTGSISVAGYTGRKRRREGTLASRLVICRWRNAPRSPVWSRARIDCRHGAIALIRVRCATTRSIGCAISALSAANDAPLRERNRLLSAVGKTRRDKPTQSIISVSRSSQRWDGTAQ